MARWLSLSEACALAMGLSSDQPLPPTLHHDEERGTHPVGTDCVDQRFEVRPVLVFRRVQGEVCRPLI